MTLLVLLNRRTNRISPAPPGSTVAVHVLLAGLHRWTIGGREWLEWDATDMTVTRDVVRALLDDLYSMQITQDSCIQSSVDSCISSVLRGIELELVYVCQSPACAVIQISDLMPTTRSGTRVGAFQRKHLLLDTLRFDNRWQ